MEKKVLRAGIVGSGFAAKFNYDALQRVFSTRVKIAGAYSVTTEKLLSFTETILLPLQLSYSFLCSYHKSIAG